MPKIRDVWLHAHSMLRCARQIINKGLRPLGLSSAEANILLHLFTHGQEMGQEQLVEQLDVSKPAVSRTLKTLEIKKCIVRQRSPDDKRAYRIQLTDKALEIGPAIEQVYNHVYELAMRGITQDELEYFLTLLGRISENLACIQTKE